MPVNIPVSSPVSLHNTFIPDGSSVLVISIIRGAYADHTTGEAMAQIAYGAGQNGEKSDTTIDNATIDNETYQYYVQITQTIWSENTYINGIKISYTITQPLP